MENVVIIGTGPAGLSAAIYAGRSQLSPLVITGKDVGGQITLTSDIENYPGFPDLKISSARHSAMHSMYEWSLNGPRRNYKSRTKNVTL